MKGITINHPNFGSEWRQIDFDSFTSPENVAKLKGSDIELIYLERHKIRRRNSA